MCSFGKTPDRRLGAAESGAGPLGGCAQIIWFGALSAWSVALSWGLT